MFFLSALLLAGGALGAVWTADTIDDPAFCKSFRASAKKIEGNIIPAQSFCSSYISIPAFTSTKTKTILTYVTSTSRLVAVTATATDPTSTIVESTTSTPTTWTTSTSTIWQTTVSTSTVTVTPTYCGSYLPSSSAGAKRDATPTPAEFTTLSNADATSQACSCLAIAISTSWSTTSVTATSTRIAYKGGKSTVTSTPLATTTTTIVADPFTSTETAMITQTTANPTTTVTSTVTATSTKMPFAFNIQMGDKWVGYTPSSLGTPATMNDTRADALKFVLSPAADGTTQLYTLDGQLVADFIGVVQFVSPNPNGSPTGFTCVANPVQSCALQCGLTRDWPAETLTFIDTDELWNIADKSYAPWWVQETPMMVAISARYS